MSVLKRKRTLSKLEFYSNAINLRRKLTFLLLRDFGTKVRVREIELETSYMEPDDAKIFMEIAQRYGIKKVPDLYPNWIIERLRDSVWDLMRDMMINITRAYTIWATNKTEAEERRICQDRAISCCESILKEMEFAIETLPVDAEKYMPLVDDIEREIALLKGWRKGDNRRNRTQQEKRDKQEKLEL